jgi:hypothetical protein
MGFDEREALGTRTDDWPAMRERWKPRSMPRRESAISMSVTILVRIR